MLTGDGIGALGDSMSMQYSFWLPLAPTFGYSIFYNGTQLNWADQLVKAGYNFGPTATYQSEKLNVYDTAIAGAYTTDLGSEMAEAQPYVSSGAIKLEVLMMGANDVGNQYKTIYTNAANHSYNPLNDPTVQTFINNVVTNLTGAVTTTLSENGATHMVLATIPNLGLTTSYQGTYPNATQCAAVTEVIQAINTQIESLASHYDFPVVDLFGLGALATSPPKIAGNQMLDAGGTSGKDAFLSDGFHPGTVLQGMIANAILMADKEAYKDPVNYLSDQTIVKNAGLTATGTNTFFNVSPYVIYNPAPIPEPSSFVLAALAGLSLIAVARGRAARQ